MMMMVSFQLPSSVNIPASRLISVPCSNARKRIGAVKPADLEWYFNPASKFRLAATSDSSAQTGIEEKKRSVIQMHAEAMPKHVAIILDGNTRWARNRGLTVGHGHKAGITRVNDVVSLSSKLGIKILTLFGFATNNWNRPQMEVDFLMRIHEDFVRSDLKQLITRHDIRFSVIGNKSRLPKSVQAAISCAEEESQGNKGMHFILASRYSGRNDIIEATKEIATKVERGILRPNEIDEYTLEQHVMTRIAEFPNPDLLIRTSGEMRVSDFYLWQMPFIEFYFTDTLFPDFVEADFLEALASYQRRQRRYGLRP